MASTTLSTIREKVRKLTRSPSVNQILDDDIDEYVNTFVLYDMPSSMNLNSLRKTFTFFTQPYIDTYTTNTTDTTHPLYNFKNVYTSVHTPVYVDGAECPLDMSREAFFSKYPLYTTIVEEGVGDGVTLNFAGTLDSVPVVKGEVHFSSISSNNDGLDIYDNGDGTMSGTGGTGTINYITGDYTLTFGTAPANLAKINAHSIPYTPTRPTDILFYQDEFTVRPIPDDVYRVTFDAYVRPTELLSSTQSPDLEQWWEYIAYGASVKVLEDRLDTEGLQVIMPAFQKQELLVERRTINEIKDNKTETMYHYQLNATPKNWWNPF